MWNNVIGQVRVKKILRQTLESKKLSNAYLFIGAEGVGKDAMAIEFAKALNCTDPKLGGIEACDECTNCREISSLGSMIAPFVMARAAEKKKTDEDIEDEDDEGKDFEIVREQLSLKSSDPYHNIQIPKAQLISVKQIRKLRLLLSRTHAGGGKQVVILSEADMMNKEAQNALLKSLEEPHENSLFVLTSSNPGKFYPTILSRCQDIRFDQISPKDISDALTERDGLEREQAEFLARLSGGSYSVARSLVSENVAELRTQVVQLLRMGLSGSKRNALGEIDKFLPKGGGAFLEKKQTVEQLLHLLTLWLRDALAIASGSEEYLFNNDQIIDLKKFTSRFGIPRNIAKAIHSVEIAQRNVALQLQLRPVMLQLVMDLESALTPLSANG